MIKIPANYDSKDLIKIKDATEGIIIGKNAIVSILVSEEYNGKHPKIYL